MHACDLHPLFQDETLHEEEGLELLICAKNLYLVPSYLKQPRLQNFSCLFSCESFTTLLPWVYDVAQFEIYPTSRREDLFGASRGDFSENPRRRRDTY